MEGNSNAETSTAFLKQLREKHTGRLIVLWDNAPAHRGDAMRAYLATPDLGLRLVNLPGYSPDFNADEAIWDWAREEVTANLCLGTKAAEESILSPVVRLLFLLNSASEFLIHHESQSMIRSRIRRVPSWRCGRPIAIHLP